MGSLRTMAAIGFLALCALGCQRQGDVVGKVTYQGKPLVFGTVLFQGRDGNVRQGNIDEDGSYAVDGLATGQASVAVNSPNPKGISLVSKSKEPAKYPDIPGWFAIPKQYEKTSTSGLTYPIKGGANKIDIELK